MNREYLLKYGIALNLLNNGPDAEFYISELSNDECWALLHKFNELRDSRGINKVDMYYLLEEIELYTPDCKVHANV